MEAEYQRGQMVVLRADRSRSGPVVEILSPVGGRPRYRVFHSATDQAIYDHAQLLPLDFAAPEQSVAEMLAVGEVLDPSTFMAQLTAARLAHPQTDNLYAMLAARIQFIPFQFKPLVRFLRGDRPRLLIADEVGVGKTIEAGLILKELSSRQQVSNVLIVCPKALVTKWRLEMQRFDEDFRPLNAGDLRYCLNEAYKDGGDWPYPRSIVHLELLRSEGYLEGTDLPRPRPGLATLDPAPQFDLVIVDEAHHLRNPGTHSHQLGEMLGEMAEAMVFLSATPVHVGSENLFSLLHLLRPDLFPDWDVFVEMMEPNRYVIGAMSTVRRARSNDDWQREAAGQMQAAANTTWGRRVLRKDPSFQYWLERLGRGEVREDGERIRCLRDLEEMHSLAHIMNRTRRRDIGAFTVREPTTIEVPFTPEQEVFYHALVDFRRRVLSVEYDPVVVRLISDTLERQAASCLPALLPVLDGFLRTGRFRASDLSDDMDLEEPDLAFTAGFVQEAEALRELARNLPPEDPKLERLRALADYALSSDGPRKLLVFSFFLHTLHYLLHHLSEGGYRVALITGGTPDEEREWLRDRFRLPSDHPEAIDILLSSEVGCEGLDYEFCDRLVNYDIPWNPMRVEQRIGRIDRYGQKAEKILIYNMITPGTVEERIFYRCYERLDIFRHAVGDLEEVLGELVQDLTRTAMDARLTPEQAEARAVQLGESALLRLEEQHRLEQEGGELLGLNEMYTEEVEDLFHAGKFVTPHELRRLVERYLDEPHIRGRLVPEQRLNRDRIHIPREVRLELAQSLRQLGRTDRHTKEFNRWLTGADPYLTVTFDQPTAVAYRDLPFITPVHPLVRLAVEHWSSNGRQLTTCLAVESETLAAGRYVFASELWESIAAKPEVRLVSLAYSLDRGTVDDEVSQALPHILGLAGAGDAGVYEADIEEALGTLDEELYLLRGRELEGLRERNALQIDRTLTSLDLYYKARLDRVGAELDAATHDRIIRMKTAERSRIGHEFQRKRTEYARRRDADIISRRVAVGLLEVTHADGL